MFNIGRICVKITGRDAGKKCVIIDVIDNHFVMIDGQTRRRKCNIKHLEPLNQEVQISKNAPAPDVVRVLNEVNIKIEEKKPGTKAIKTKTERPRRTRKKKEKPVKQSKAGTKEVKKKSVEKIETKKPIGNPKSKENPSSDNVVA
jgi:large subunit ribosomal protein L14e